MRGARPWAGLLIFAALLVALLFVDSRIKRATLAGYWPADAEWIGVSSDFPRFWKDVGNSKGLQEAAKEIRADINDLTLQVYRATGIRPTPLRYWMWMGNGLTAATSKEGTGICVKPGLLLRARMALGRHASLGDGVYVYGDNYYGWRDGFFIGGTSAAYVRSALKADSIMLEYQNEPGLTLHHFADPKLALHLNPGSAAPIAGYIGEQIQSRNKPLELADLHDNLIEVDATSPGDVLDLLMTLGKVVRNLNPPLLPVIERLSEPLIEHYKFPDFPMNWDTGLSETAAFLVDVDQHSAIPVPVASAILRYPAPVFGAHPLQFLANDQSINYEWRGRSGLIMPFMGEKMTLCLGSSEQDWLVTTEEPIMAKLVESPPKGEVKADAYLGVDLARLSQQLSALFIKAADMELIPWMNGKDVQAIYVPRLNALGKLGRCELFFSSDPGRTQFAGRFSNP